jgi:hypothetical protein
MNARPLLWLTRLSDCPRRRVFVNRTSGHAGEALGKWRARRFYVMSDDAADTSLDSFEKSVIFAGIAFAVFGFG